MVLQRFRPVGLLPLPSWTSHLICKPTYRNRGLKQLWKGCLRCRQHGRVVLVGQPEVLGQASVHEAILFQGRGKVFSLALMKSGYKLACQGRAHRKDVIFFVLQPSLDSRSLRFAAEFPSMQPVLQRLPSDPAMTYASPAPPQRPLHAASPPAMSQSLLCCRPLSHLVEPGRGEQATITH